MRRPLPPPHLPGLGATPPCRRAERASPVNPVPPFPILFASLMLTRALHVSLHSHPFPPCLGRPLACGARVWLLLIFSLPCTERISLPTTTLQFVCISSPSASESLLCALNYAYLVPKQRSHQRMSPSCDAPSCGDAVTSCRKFGKLCNRNVNLWRHLCSSVPSLMDLYHNHSCFRNSFSLVKVGAQVAKMAVLSLSLKRKHGKL